MRNVGGVRTHLEARKTLSSLEQEHNTIRQAAVGVLSLRRAPKLGKLLVCYSHTRSRAYQQQSYPHTKPLWHLSPRNPPVRTPRQLAPTVGRYYYYATTLLLVSLSGRDHFHLYRRGLAPSL